MIKVLVSVEDMWSRGMWWPGELHGKKGLFATEHVESFNQENVRRSELSDSFLYCVYSDCFIGLRIRSVTVLESGVHLLTRDTQTLVLID